MAINEKHCGLPTPQIPQEKGLLPDLFPNAVKEADKDAATHPDQKLGKKLAKLAGATTASGVLLGGTAGAAVEHPSVREVVEKVGPAVVVLSKSLPLTKEFVDSLGSGSAAATAKDLIKGPESYGRIELEKGTTVVPIGDSLARGLGSSPVEGIKDPEGKAVGQSWVGPFTRLVNKESPDLAQPRYIPELAIPSKSAEQLRDMLKANKEKLTAIPTPLLLGATVAYKDLNTMAKDLSKQKKPSLEERLQKISAHIDEYRGDLRDVLQTIDEIQNERAKKYGPERGATQFFAIGLPNLEKVPAVAEKEIPPYLIALLTNTINTALKNTIEEVDTTYNGVVHAYVDLYRKTLDPNDISLDKLHPKDSGYRKIADTVKETSVYAQKENPGIPPQK